MVGMSLISHRGLVSPAFTENTIGTFRAVMTTPCRFIEFDVRKTKDGVPVVFHDPHLKRIAGVPGWVHAMEWSRLKEINLKGGERIPSLLQVLSEFKNDVKFDIEIKTENTAAAVLQDIATSRVSPEDVVITSFKWKEIEEVRKIAPEVKTGLISSGFPLRCIRKCHKIGANVAVLFHACVDADVVEYAKSRGVEIYVFTVNDKQRIETLLEYGVEKVITDTPTILQ
ncbi:glycerophosphoryl diester phosphodiesterase [Acanthocystis turfacea Chlorella virus NE-JV-2]|nr:glycerophosphoryl diester phosphodiesterase [Acanthocystis turfacea Chlorella virus NE-JV-2]